MQKKNYCGPLSLVPNMQMHITDMDSFSRRWGALMKR